MDRKGAATEKRAHSDRALDRDWREHREKLLDEALEQTFPASDPPSIAGSRND